MITQQSRASEYHYVIEVQFSCAPALERLVKQLVERIIEHREETGYMPSQRLTALEEKMAKTLENTTEVKSKMDALLLAVTAELPALRKLTDEQSKEIERLKTEGDSPEQVQKLEDMQTEQDASIQRLEDAIDAALTGGTPSA